MAEPHSLHPGHTEARQPLSSRDEPSVGGRRVDVLNRACTVLWEPEVGGALFSFLWGIRYQGFWKEHREGVCVSWISQSRGEQSRAIKRDNQMEFRIISQGHQKLER